MKSKIHRYAGQELTVTFDSARCIHTGRCLKALPVVFDVNAKPWVQPDNAAAQQVIEAVGRCPSGALAVQPLPDEPGQDENTLELRKDGPIYARGRLALAKLSGETLLEDTRLTLCRCGASQNKPLCDNSHIKSNFHASAELGRLAADGGDGPDGALTVSAAPNGPLLLDGPAEIRGLGASVKVRKAALCRCGLSENKPYCDGSHATGGFQAE
jgi:CDGSH-type Zn-finger protein/uncharacterized Fe-S cluster protein YjdI